MRAAKFRGCLALTGAFTLALLSTAPSLAAQLAAPAASSASAAAPAARIAAVVLGVWALVSLLYRALGVRAVGRLVRAGGPLGAAAPRVESVALLRPLCGAPAYLESCLKSLWEAAGEAQAPICVAIEDPADPAHKEIVRLREAFPGVAAEVFSGRARSGWNRKVANLAQIEVGQSELLVLSDADVRVPRDYVARVAAPFADPRVGLSTAPYRSVAAPGVASRCDALLTNLHFLPNTCFAVEFEGLHFALGSTLAVRRSVLEEMGGFEAIVDESADDAAIARRAEARGWRLAWLPLFVDHVLEDVGLRAALARHVRCARISRSTRPMGFVGLLLVMHGWLGAVAAGALWTAAGGAGAWLPLFWWSALLGLTWRRREALGIDALDLALAPAVDVLGLGVMLAALSGRPAPPPPRAGAVAAVKDPR